jgi:hypothetical protein
MTRSARRKDEAVQSVLEEAQEKLLAAFKKSSSTKHRGIMGDGRSQSVLDVLERMLPQIYGFIHKGEAVDYRDSRSGEIDIAIYDKLRNAPLSEGPSWLPAESLLAVIEVKSVLTRKELEKAYLASKALNSLRPFKQNFTLARADEKDPSEIEPVGTEQVLVPSNIATQLNAKVPKPLRCFRTIFAYETDLVEDGWLMREWNRLERLTQEIDCDPALIDRILVLDRGIINPPARQGADKTEFLSTFHQWFVGLANFLARENRRRLAFDWQTYQQKRVPGWRKFPDGRS